MKRRDALGHTYSGGKARSVELFEQALGELSCLVGDPLGTIDRALAESPDLVMGHLMRAYLHLIGTEPSGTPVARAALEVADRLPADGRERGHREAVRALVEGRWHDAGRALEDVSLEHPRDRLALFVGHQIDFFTGRSRMLRDRIARALPSWDESMPGFHALLGMHAFGLEECGDYARAEAEGRRAVELERRDGWAWHAVAHVLEMQNRRADGIAWLRSDTDAWSRDSFFQVHVWWHLALFHLDLGQVNDVLALLDGPIYGGRSQVVLDLIDATSLMWRFHLMGIDMGDRWQAAADAWTPIARAGGYAFNDAHAMMAFVGAGRAELARELLDAQAARAKSGGDNAEFTREVGWSVVRAVHAFGTGAYAEAVRLLRPVRDIAFRFGGSHAQRDVLDLTLLEAARRSGQHALVRGLEAERSALRSGMASAPAASSAAGAAARAVATHRARHNGTPAGAR